MPAASVYLHSAVTAEISATGVLNLDAPIEDPDLDLSALPSDDLLAGALDPADASRILWMAGAFQPDSAFGEPEPQDLWG